MEKCTTTFWKGVWVFILLIYPCAFSQIDMNITVLEYGFMTVNYNCQIECIQLHAGIGTTGLINSVPVGIDFMSTGYHKLLIGCGLCGILMFPNSYPYVSSNEVRVFIEPFLRTGYKYDLDDISYFVITIGCQYKRYIPWKIWPTAGVGLGFML